MIVFRGEYGMERNSIRKVGTADNAMTMYPNFCYLFLRMIIFRFADDIGLFSFSESNFEPILKVKMSKTKLHHTVTWYNQPIMC